jgi:hypothetical protein
MNPWSDSINNEPPNVPALIKTLEDGQRDLYERRKEQAERELLPKLSPRQRAVGQGYISAWIRLGDASIDQLRLNIIHAEQCIPPGIKIAGFDDVDPSRARALKVLGLSSDPSRDEIISAYRKAAKATHPDAGGDSESFRRVNDAYNFLLSNGGIWHQ